jgi:hypothetical protein
VHWHIRLAQTIRLSPGSLSAEALLDKRHLIVLPGVLVAGLFIWIDSLVRAWRERDLPSIGIAAWNTFAQVHNTYAAVEGVGGAAKSVGSLFSSADPDDIKGTALRP